MMTDPQDFIFVEACFEEQRRDARRHITIPDREWVPVADREAHGGKGSRLRARIILNKIPMDVELLLSDLCEDPPGHAETAGEQQAELRVQGHRYRVVGLYAV